MSEIPQTGNETLPPSLAAGVDRACDRFEAVWKAGQRPHIEDYLEDAPEAARLALLRELVLLEVEYRSRSGERPQAQDYQACFPMLDVRWLAGAVTPARAGKPSPLPAESTPSLPFVPGYEILGVLGRGGMGVVYKARHQRLQRIVALKMVLAGAHAGPEERARFHIEVEAVARLQHPNIVQVYEVGDCAGLPYCALEYVPGGSLAKKLKGEPFPLAAAARLVKQLAWAVHHAHAQAVIHRDLKPGNVLLTADGTPKITDFGLAKRLDNEMGLTRSGAVMGTPSYMAPEQAEGRTKKIGPGTDVYALGAILYELLTGEPPFRADTPLETLQQVISEEPVPPRQLRPAVSRDLQTICLKCLRKDPRQRYGSARALAADLRRFLDGEPVRARRIGAVRRIVELARRYPLLTILVAAVLLSTAVGFLHQLTIWDRFDKDWGKILDENKQQREQWEREIRNRQNDSRWNQVMPDNRSSSRRTGRASTPAGRNPSEVMPP